MYSNREGEQVSAIEQDVEAGTLIAVEAIDVPSVFGEGRTDEIISYVREQVGGFVPDASTAKGRSEIKSLAYKVTRSRTLLDDAGKRYAADLKAKVKKIDGARKRLRDELDAIRDTIRQPLTEWEKAEAAREAEIDMLLMSLQQACQMSADAGLEQLRHALKSAEGAKVDESFGRRAGEAMRLRETAISSLERAIKRAQDIEAERQELERLRREAAEREAKEAAARERAEMEERVRRETQERAEREAREKIERAEREAREARLAEERAKREAQEAAERAEREKQEAIARAKADEERRRREAEEQAAREKAEQEARERDLEHRRAVNKAAVEALATYADLSDEQAKAVVVCIAQGLVPAVKVHY